ncbi:MAG: hypothetical protein LBC09_02990 [Helicobacteraceae bacterium]|jgi:hypothetical protein|nr:hypothetical protein [Helicobacteraceae bacterium]
MKRLLEALKKKMMKNKTFIIVVIIIYALTTVHYFYSSFFSQLYFYLKNGNVVDLEYYYIEAPFPKWVISGRDDFGYVMSVKKDFRYAISTAENESIDIAISRSVGKPNDPDFELVSTVLCWKAEEAIYKSYDGFYGIKRLYSDFKGGYVMLFHSEDFRFYLIITSYKPTEENEKYLDLLLNSVKKKSGV